MERDGSFAGVLEQPENAVVDPNFAPVTIRGTDVAPRTAPVANVPDTARNDTDFEPFDATFRGPVRPAGPPGSAASTTGSRSASFDTPNVALD